MTAVLPSSHALDELVSHVAGVRVVYPARSLALTLAAAARYAGRTAPPAAAVEVETNGDSIRVTARIGIDPRVSSVDVCSRVHDVIAAYLRQSKNVVGAHINVIVARIG